MPEKMSRELRRDTCEGLKAAHACLKKAFKHAEEGDSIECRAMIEAAISHCEAKIREIIDFDVTQKLEQPLNPPAPPAV